MSKSIYERELTWFKKNEKPEPVLLVANNPHQLRIVVAWTNMDVGRRKRLTGHPHGSASERWKWLWSNCRFSQEGLMTKGAVPADSFETKLAALIGNRVLYPDGTVNSFVMRYLHERVLKLLDAKSAMS